MINVKPPPNNAPLFINGQVPDIEWGKWFDEVKRAVNEKPVWLQFAEDASGITASQYLDMDTNPMSATWAVPLLRAGSVTGVSAVCVVNSFNAGAKLSIDVRINNSKVFGSETTVTATGTVKWGDTQNIDIDTYNERDLLQVYLTITGTINIDDPIALVELTVGG